MELDVGVVAQERIDLLGFVSGEVVEDDVDLQVWRLLFDQIAQEGHKLLARVPRGCLSEDVSRKGVECGVQRLGTAERSLGRGSLARRGGFDGGTEKNSREEFIVLNRPA